MTYNLDLTEGLIPAHAGKTTPPSTNSEPLRAHPRSRGENLFDKTHVTSRRGSSPLTRGKRANSDDNQTDRGLIPAHAGKTALVGVARCGDRAHPRSRGENTDPGITSEVG